MYVHVTRLDGANGRTCAGIRHHEGTVEEGDVGQTASGLLATTPLRAVIEKCLAKPAALT